MFQRSLLCLLIATLLLLGPQPPAQAEAPHPRARASRPPTVTRAPATPAQGGWTTIPLPNASCGTGAPYKYFVNLSTLPNQPLVIYFEGGGACIKDGTAPGGTGGAARELYCMNYTNFGEPQATLLPFYGIFRRDLTDNAFRNANYAFIPYCTGDLHAGTATTPYDYNPDPSATFNVTHRGHLNTLAALSDLTTRFTATTPIILTGSSAGGLGALYNFPAVIQRWPNTTLVADAGTLPNVPKSLLQQLMARPALPWSPQAILPAYCPTLDCFADTTRLMDAHAAHYDGDPAPWRPFGMIQGQLDQTMSSYMEITTCDYQRGLARGAAAISQPNLRTFLPSTTLHTFFPAPPDSPLPGLGTYRHTIAGVSVMTWTAQLVDATDEATLPASRHDPWPLFADLNNSTTVDVVDIRSVATQWATATPACPQDYNGDNAIDIIDIMLVSSHFGQTQ